MPGRVQQQLVDQAEDGRVRSDSHSQCKHRDDGKSWGFCATPRGVAEIGEGGFKPRQAALVSIASLADSSPPNLSIA